MNNRIVLGVDIGGTHITATLVDLENSELIKSSQVRELVNAKGTSSEIITSWSNVIKSAFSTQNLSIGKIGIAMPGPFDYDNGIAWMKDQDKFDSLYGLNVKEMLAKALQISPDNIQFANDAESFLKGEVFNGAAKGSSKVIGLTIGTGMGSASCFNNQVEDANLWCTPFLDGIAEDYLSTRWFVARFLLLSGKTVKGVKELATLAKDNSEAQQVFKEFGYNLALFIKEIVLTEKPATIVIGGNISNAFQLFYDQVEKNFEGLSFKPFIKKAMLGEDAALIGAASCWVEMHQEALTSSGV